MGPQKLATIIGHKYSIFKPSKKNKGVFLIIKIRQIIHSKKNFKNFNFLGLGTVKKRRQNLFLVIIQKVFVVEKRVIPL